MKRFPIDSIWVAFGAAFFCLVLTAKGQLWYSSNFDGGEINPSTHALTDPTVPPFLQPVQPQDEGTFTAPQLTTEDALGGSGKSLLTSLPETPNNTAPDGSISDRFEYIWVNEQSDPKAPAFDGTPRFLGFAMRWVPGSSVPTNKGMVWMQFWQGGSSSDKIQPPVYLWLDAATGMCQLNYKPTYDATPTTLYQWSPDFSGKWHKYVIEIRPGWHNNGFLALWIDGVEVRSFSGAIGYQPDIIQPGLPLSTMRVKTGLYRHRGNPAIAAEWDNIKYAGNYTDAAP